MFKSPVFLVGILIGIAACSLLNLFIKVPLSIPIAILAITGGAALVVVLFVKIQNATVDTKSTLGFMAYWIMSFMSISTGFSSIYMELVRQNKDSFHGIIDGLSALFFSIDTFATVGYGEIFPISLTAKMLVMSEIMVSIVLLPVVIATSLAWIINQKQVQKQEAGISGNINDKKYLSRIK